MLACRAGRAVLRLHSPLLSHHLPRLPFPFAWPYGAAHRACCCCLQSAKTVRPKRSRRQSKSRAKRAKASPKDELPEPRSLKESRKGWQILQIDNVSIRACEREMAIPVTLGTLGTLGTVVSFLHAHGRCGALPTARRPSLGGYSCSPSRRGTTCTKSSIRKRSVWLSSCALLC